MTQVCRMPRQQKEPTFCPVLFGTATLSFQLWASSCRTGKAIQHPRIQLGFSEMYPECPSPHATQGLPSWYTTFPLPNTCSLLLLQGHKRLTRAPDLVCYPSPSPHYDTDLSILPSPTKYHLSLKMSHRDLELPSSADHVPGNTLKVLHTHYDGIITQMLPLRQHLFSPFYRWTN